MSEAIKPENEEQLREAIQWAVAEEASLAVIGRDSKRALGRPVTAKHQLNMSAIAGITVYQPEELVMTVKAATPLSDIEAALAEHDQELAFEPVNYDGLLNGVAGANQSSGTIGGVIACNLSGSRRVKVGAARDHLLGFHAVSGRGDLFKSGGQVVKNVTGFDLSKLMAGSFGTLGVMTEVSIKVLPLPEKIRTILILGADDEKAMQVMTAALHSPYEVSGAAHVPAAITPRSAVSNIADSRQAVTAIRVEGVAPSVESRCESLKKLLQPFGAIEELHTANSKTYWRETGNVLFFAGSADRNKQIWKISVPPASAAGIATQLRQGLSGEVYYDWGGGLLWLAISPETDAAQDEVRAALISGGHATLIRADEAVRKQVEVFQPQPAPLAALSARVKDAFDPKQILNPGRMVAGV
ncbi:MAG: glycolate oxidase subunit GlcE [Rhodospirillaceae bacterium]|jgi:glycolate oxidase FAD binding subunit